MIPCGFFQFPDMKMLLKGNRYQDMEEIKQNAMTQQLAIQRVTSKILHTMEGLLQQVCGHKNLLIKPTITHKRLKD
jgi:hypothetical protein